MWNFKKNMRDRARDVKRLANALVYDTECVFEDTESYDLWCLGELLHETKITLRRLFDNITELEYMVCLSNRDSKVEKNE